MISRAGPGYEATSIDDAESEPSRIPVGDADLPIERGTFDAIDRTFG